MGRRVPRIMVADCGQDKRLSGLRSDCSVRRHGATVRRIVHGAEVLNPSQAPFALR